MKKALENILIIYISFTLYSLDGLEVSKSGNYRTVYAGWVELLCLPSRIRSKSKYLILIDVFNDNQLKKEKNFDQLKMNNCGHDSEYLIPTINQFNELYRQVLKY